MRKHHGAIGLGDGALIAVVCVVWAGNFFFSKLALRELPPIAYTALRLLGLGVVLAPLMKRPSPGGTGRLVAYALCTAVHFGLGFWALRLSRTIGSPMILLQSYVPMSALLARWLLKERITPAAAGAIAFSFCGVLVLGFDPGVLEVPAVLPVILLSAFFLALGSVLLRTLVGLDVYSQQGWTAWIGVWPLVAGSLAVEPEPLAAIARASWVAWVGVAYAALFVSLLGHGLFYVLVRRHGVARVTPYLLASPVITALLGVAFLGDQLGPRVLVGGAMVLGVLAMALRSLAVSERAPVDQPNG